MPPYHKHRQHERKLFRQHRHAESNASQQCVQPGSAQQPVEHDNQSATEQPTKRRDANQTSSLAAQPWWGGLDISERLANAADLAVCAGCVNFRYSLPPDHQRA